MKKIIPHLWYDKEAGEAAEFYVSLFDNSKIIEKTILQDTPSGTAELLRVELAGQEFMLLSAGPYFKPTPAVSLHVACSTTSEVEQLWEKLIADGAALMPLDSYPFSEKYGWVADKYGVSWQLMYMENSNLKQKITPTLMFTGKFCEKASVMNDMMKDKDKDKVFKVTEAFLNMKKFDIAELNRVYEEK